MTFDEFFQNATGFDPYPYQKSLAVEVEFPAQLSVPTGLGKTGAVTLAWLWRRLFAAEAVKKKTPRRLIYCLPMRVLVEQTARCCRDWLEGLSLLAENAPQNHPCGRVAVHVLMGGDLESDWDNWPEREQILVGTQDMLLSRALNRGYAMSRFRWPIQFGLLNNDCLWVMDEVQLMGSGLSTTTQLQAFRRKLGAVGPNQSIWMSATMRPEWLETVDVDLTRDAPRLLELGNEDMAEPKIQARFQAAKSLERAPFCCSRDGKAEASFLSEVHREGTRTLAVVNTVERAQAIYQALKRNKLDADLVLLHSRFRPTDRKDQLATLLADPKPSGTIAISTQVVEAGVDISSTTLITDLAPWSSLIQRFGRCNRGGQDDDARVIWIEPTDLNDDKKLKAAPYTPAELQEAAQQLSMLDDVGPQKLPPFEGTLNPHHVVRRKDLLELFDTTPDLAGADIDVSRFIRDADDHDVQVFWRNVPDTGPTAGEPRPCRNELCRVPISNVKKIQPCWRWDHLERNWVRPNAIYPGLVLMLPTSGGGYSTELGWTGNKKDKLTAIELPSQPEEANDDDNLSSLKTWQTLAHHTDLVVREMEILISAVAPWAVTWQETLRTAARWHDAGKAHAVFQRAMLGDPPTNDGERVWAKSNRDGVSYIRPGFRHELASALAMLLAGHADLATYLAAAHHGKVRLSIRSLPHEKHPEQLHTRFARGIWDGDDLPSADLGGGVTLPETSLDLAFMELGESSRGPSWLTRMLALRDSADLGPFRLAWLEALLRIADWRGSGGTGANGGIP